MIKMESMSQDVLLRNTNYLHLLLRISNQLYLVSKVNKMQFEMVLSRMSRNNQCREQGTIKKHLVHVIRHAQFLEARNHSFCGTRCIQFACLMRLHHLQGVTSKGTRKLLRHDLHGCKKRNNLVDRPTKQKISSHKDVYIAFMTHTE